MSLAFGVELLGKALFKHMELISEIFLVCFEECL